jgi:acid phosphatase type 7
MSGKLIVFWALALAACLSGTRLKASEQFDPPALYLTWQDDPSTTMVIHWQTEDEAKTEVYYRVRGSTNGWLVAQGQHAPLPTSNRTVHRVGLISLVPDGSYEFCFWPGERKFYFRTAPADLERPIRFVAGGDVYIDRDALDTMNELAGKLDPLFVVWGGDLAYSCERALKPEKMERWYAFWDSWKRTGRAPDGRLIPLLVTIGNHEVPGSWKQSPEMAAVYYTQFPTPGNQGYQAIVFGSYLAVLLLDSGITHPIDGEQLAWLDDTLRATRTIRHVFPVYHIPAYPSVRSESDGENGELTQQVRSLWCPLFERAGVRIAFEHHDHAYKRTHPIKNGKLDPTGIIYLGDGAWGVRLRKPDSKRWYLARTEATRHLFLTTISTAGQQILAVNEKGEFFDEIYRPVTDRR